MRRKKLDERAFLLRHVEFLRSLHVTSEPAVGPAVEEPA
jgi:hypothetical protein